MNQRSFLRYLMIIGLLAHTAHQAGAQISEGGLPPSFGYAETLRSEPKRIRIPVNFSVEDLKNVDTWQTAQNGLLRVATLIDTDINLSEAAEPVTLPDGRSVCRLRLQATGAIALMLYYKTFYIPEGARLFIYNADQTHLLGAYTSQTNPSGGRFATEFVAGDDLTLEYVPAPSGETPRIEIEQIGYGYNHLSVSSDLRSGRRTELSGSCMVNINCEEGEAWQIQKKGVCRMVEKIGESSFLCSGSLVNNTAQDQKPYILSAFHCTVNSSLDQSATASDLEQWVFYFHYERNGCDNSSSAYAPKTMVGCTKVAFTPITQGSDGLLLLLNQSIPLSYDVFFNGWDRSNQKAVSGVGIHHPAGDYMKISTYGKQVPQSSTWQDAGSLEQSLPYSHWLVIFDETSNGYAVTEGGSSGSPLFNQNKLITGTLSGGNSSCDYPDGINLYGKLFYHWNKYSEKNNNRMDVWLDPLQTGTTVLNGLSQSGEKTPTYSYRPPTDLKAARLHATEVSLNWKMPVDKQIITWANEMSLYKIGLQGEPFYFGQRWKPEDLKAIDRRMLTAVSFIPDPFAEYALFIRQGERIYTQEVNHPEEERLTTYALKTPFVIDAGQDLIVAVYAKSYGASDHPAHTDNGPMVAEKGFIYSSDGENWIYDSGKFNYNFVVCATIRSEKGEITDTRSLSASSLAPALKKAVGAPAFHSVKAEEVPIESMPVRAFAEVTGYNVYRNEARIASLPASTTKYTDKKAFGGSSFYEVSAVYEEEESEPAGVEIGSTVGIETPEGDAIALSPTVFKEQIRLANAERVRLLTIYSAEGKLIKQLTRPQATIDTNAFPQGIYIFHLHTEEGVKVIEGIKL